ncbi:Nedd8-conjugating enzyme UBE2F [Halotydeus destructor]|nr:Nedd8-conjugating enzyme UBE2F [Halotydeus destructor]
MIKLSRKLKRNEENNNERLPNATTSRNRISVRDKLLIREVQEMEQTLPSTCTVSFPNADALHQFDLFIEPVDCYWSGGRFKFAIQVPEDYNFVPPVVKCLTQIWHPNINEAGDICLSLLRVGSVDGLGWAPTRTLKDIIWGLDSLFTDLLNFEDPLNDQAAQHYQRDKKSFKDKVRDYVRRYARV